MKKNHKLPLSMVLSGGVLLIIILATLLATLSPYDPIAVETGQKFLPPSAQHLLGTDNFGRDTFTRLLYGGRVSLLVGFLSMLISIVFGTVYGIVSGSSGKLVDGFMMRIVDIIYTVPDLLIIILLMALIIRLFYVAYRASTPFSALIAVGVGGMLLFQTFMNIFMNVGLLPVMGLTLPFFSYGGTSIVTMFAALGIAAGVRMREKPSWLQN